MKLLLALGLLFSLPTHARLPRLGLNAVAAKVDCSSEKPEICQRLVKRHLIRDIKNCQIDPAHVAHAPALLKAANMTSGRVLGSNGYLGFFPGIYSYSWKLSEAGGVHIIANVHFWNRQSVAPEHLQGMQNKLTEAAAKWSHYNPFAFPLTFEFKQARAGDQKDLRTHLLVGKYTRGPYFLNWTTVWSANTVAHEMGHVMGLDDEYSNTPWRELGYCHASSMMCTSSGRPFPYHYYLVARRLMCRL